MAVHVHEPRPDLGYTPARRLGSRHGSGPDTRHHGHRHDRGQGVEVEHPVHRQHRRQGAQPDDAEQHDADWCLSLFPATEAGRYMGLKLDAEGRIEALRHEDQRPGRPANGGVYWVQARVWQTLPTQNGPLSLEDDCLPSALAAGQRLFGMGDTAPFIDPPYRFADSGLTDTWPPPALISSRTLSGSLASRTRIFPPSNASEM